MSGIRRHTQRHPGCPLISIGMELMKRPESVVSPPLSPLSRVGRSEAKHRHPGIVGSAKISGTQASALTNVILMAFNPTLRPQSTTVALPRLRDKTRAGLNRR